MSTKAVILVTMTAVILLLGLGCSGGSGSHTGGDWVVSVGSTGGFTGRGSGYRIHADGVVESWTSVIEEGDFATEKIGRTDETQLRTLFEAMQDPRVRAASGSLQGSMTSFLEWNGKDDHWRCIWDSGSDPDAPVRKAYDQVMHIVETVEAGT